MNAGSWNVHILSGVHYIYLCLCVTYILFSNLGGRGKSVDTPTQENVTHPPACSLLFWQQPSFKKHMQKKKKHMHDHHQHADVVSVWVSSAVCSHRVKTALLLPMGTGFQRNLERLVARYVLWGLLREISKRGGMPASPWEECFTRVGSAMTGWFFWTHA